MTNTHFLYMNVQSCSLFELFIINWICIKCKCKYKKIALALSETYNRFINIEDYLWFIFVYYYDGLYYIVHVYPSLCLMTYAHVYCTHKTGECWFYHFCYIYIYSNNLPTPAEATTFDSNPTTTGTTCLWWCGTL